MTTANDYDDMIGDGVDSELRRQLAAKRRQEVLEYKVGLVEAYGDDPFDDGDVIKFIRTIVLERVRVPTTYDATYAAIKVKGKWYTTGGKQCLQAATWDEFVLWLVEGPNPTTRLEQMVFNPPLEVGGTPVRFSEVIDVDQ